MPAGSAFGAKQIVIPSFTITGAFPCSTLASLSHQRWLTSSLRQMFPARRWPPCCRLGAPDLHLQGRLFALCLSHEACTPLRCGVGKPPFKTGLRCLPAETRRKCAPRRPDNKVGRVRSQDGFRGARREPGPPPPLGAQIGLHSAGRRPQRRHRPQPLLRREDAVLPVPVIVSTLEPAPSSSMSFLEETPHRSQSELLCSMQRIKSFAVTATAVSSPSCPRANRWSRWVKNLMP